MEKSISENIVEALKKVWGTQVQVPLHAPTFLGNENIYVQDTINSTFVSSIGRYVERFEQMLVDFTGIPHAVAVVNGTNALHMALHLVGVKYGDEVLLPGLSFVATANAVSYCGAVPHFIDVDSETLGADPYKLDDYLKNVIRFAKREPINKFTKRPIRALVPMHTFGHPVRLDELSEIAKKYRLQMVEDAAESLGSFYKGQHTGSVGDCSIFSFNGNKIVTTGGGGAILTKSLKVAERAKYLTTTAKKKHRWEYYHDEIGYNFRMPNINAALGCAQLEQLNDFILQKRALAENYERAFLEVPNISFFKEPQYAKSNYWLNTLMLDNSVAYEKEHLLEDINEAGYMVRPAWVLLNRLPMYCECPKMDLSASENVARRIINIPSSVPDVNR